MASRLDWRIRVVSRLDLWRIRVVTEHVWPLG